MPALAAPLPAIEFNISSVGMSKGIAQTTGPQFVARGELAFGTWFVGGYVKNVDSSTSSGEAGALIGIRRKVVGFDFSASAALKRAIDPAPSFDTNALELNATASRKLNTTIARLSIVWSPDDLGATRDSLFVEAGASQKLSSFLSASAAFGRRQRSGGPDYNAWNAGLTWNPAKPLSIDLRYYDTNGGSSQPFRPRAVISARARF